VSGSSLEWFRRGTLGLLMLLMLPASASEPPAPERLREGRIRYALATGDLPEALRHLPGLSGASAPFLRARAWYQAGFRERALAEFQQVLEGPWHRGEAALVLARAALADGDQTSAQDRFEQAARLGPATATQEALYQLAMLALRSGQADQAGDRLARMPEGYWAASGYVNLARHYAEEDLSPTRALVALRVALAMTAKDPLPERAKALRDRILIRSGYLAYRNGDPGKALGFLEQVSLTSTSTPRALYLHGLARMAQGNYRAAMQSWHRARKFPLAYPGAADAWLGMGQGYDRAGYLGQAGEAYLAANAAYESERVTLRTLARDIHDRGAYPALVQAARNDDVEWFLADNRTLQQPRLAYLLDFLEQPEAQQAVAAVARLQGLEQQLIGTSRDLALFAETLARGHGDAGRLPELTARNQTLLERVRAARTQVSPTPQGPWFELEQSLVLAAHALNDLSAPAGNGDSRVRIGEYRTLGEAYLRQVSELRRRAEARLDALALDYVNRQDQRMARALGKAEQRIAHLYEYLALETLGEASP
jgi:hypothetical protein